MNENRFEKLHKTHYISADCAGNFGVFDSAYAKENFYIHEYFLAKSIDKLKPNGIMAVITSAKTMDKRNQSLRKYVADRAELIGAIRLPNTAFIT